MTLRAAALVASFLVLAAVCVGAVLSSRAPDATNEMTPMTAEPGAVEFEPEPAP